MSRPQKLHKPLKGGFNEILGAVAIGKGKAKRAANRAAKNTHNQPKCPPKK